VQRRGGGSSLARRLRYYEKKRGNRRTGSETLGSAGEALFFAILLLLGCGGLVALLVFLVVPEWRVNHEFVETTCRVEQKRLGQTDAEDGTLYRPELKIEYQVQGVTYHSPWTYDIGHAYSSGREDKEAILAGFTSGKQYTCWYDPADPYVVVLVRGYSWWIWLVFLIPVSFILIGGGGVLYSALHWGKSAERCAAMARRAPSRDVFDAGGRSAPALVNVPDDSDITNSPGTRLRFRLPIGSSPGWVLFGVLVACLLWNGIVFVFALHAVRGHLQGKPDWLLTLFTTPFVLVGIGLIVVFIRQLLLTTGVGPTLLEISAHPLHPGGQCRLFVSQSGRLKMNSLEVLLICEEAATYRQGTDTRTETREVCRQEVFRREGFEVRHGVPFEAECEFAVPAGAMHSFKAEHNEVNWKLVVEGHVAGWPDYKRAFPVVIHPPNGRTEG
jgi:hypothetical protein